jgi:hypothetical protein
VNNSFPIDSFWLVIEPTLGKTVRQESRGISPDDANRGPCPSFDWDSPDMNDPIPGWQLGLGQRSFQETEFGFLNASGIV